MQIKNVIYAYNIILKNKLNISKLIIISAFAIAIYVIIILLSDISMLTQNFSKINSEFIFLALLFFSLGYIIRSLRWIFMLKFLKIHLPIFKTLIIYFTGYAFSLTPGKLGEVVKSKYLEEEFKIPKTQSIPTVFVERYYDVIGVVLIILVSYGIFESSNTVLILGGIIAVVSYVIIRSRIRKKIFTYLEKIKLFSKILKKLIASFDIFDELLKPQPFIVCTSLTIFAWILEALGAFFVFQSFSMNLDVTKAVFIYLITSFIGASTFLPGGVGGTEGSMLGFLILEGYSYEESLGPTIIIRFFALWYAIIIGLFFTFLYKTKIRKLEN